MASITRDIFKAYDIRGIVGKTLTDDAAYFIGRAIAAKAAEKGIARIAIGRDGRLSGPELMEHIQRGLTDSGIGVLNVGMVTTPMLYFAAVNECGGSGVMITGSHNPPDYNGFKMMLGGDTLAGEAIQELLAIVEKDGFVAADKQGSVTEKDISGAYHDHIVGHVKLKRPI
ncbi:phosphomannomutase/phosphoglucomutase, partial [Escherichia coli]|nr:phosphomannomutase/phosphoglucomutase [Escherichia coli]